MKCRRIDTFITIYAVKQKAADWRFK